MTDIPYGVTKDYYDPSWTGPQFTAFLCRVCRMIGETGAAYIFCSEQQHHMLVEKFEELQEKVRGSQNWKAKLGYLVNFVCFSSSS